jgi:hypothetical protein
MTFNTDRELQEADKFDFVAEIDNELKKANKCKVVNKKMLKNAEKQTSACPSRN